MTPLGVSDPSSTPTEHQTGKLCKPATWALGVEDKAQRSQQTWTKTSDQPQHLDTTKHPGKQPGKQQTSSLIKWPCIPLNTPAPLGAETISDVQEWEERMEKGQAGMHNGEQQD